MKRTFTLPCGCKHDHVKWLEMCAKDRAEHDARHAQAQADRVAAGFTTTPVQS